jgi:hypothetical protein
MTSINSPSRVEENEFRTLVYGIQCPESSAGKIKHELEAEEEAPNWRRRHPPGTTAATLLPLVQW